MSENQGKSDIANKQTNKIRNDDHELGYKIYIIITIIIIITIAIIVNKTEWK